MATVNTAEEEGESADPRRGNNPEVATTATAVTEVDTAVDTEEEAMAMEVKVHHLLEAQPLGSNRMPAMVLQAWTATALHHHLRRLVGSRHHRLPATCRRPLRLRHSSGLSIKPLEEICRRLTCTGFRCTQSVECDNCAIEKNNTSSNIAVCLILQGSA